MTDEKLPDFSDIDWDAALNEWDHPGGVASRGAVQPDVAGSTPEMPTHHVPFRDELSKGEERGASRRGSVRPPAPHVPLLAAQPLPRFDEPLGEALNPFFDPEPKTNQIPLDRGALPTEIPDRKGSPEAERETVPPGAEEPDLPESARPTPSPPLALSSAEAPSPREQASVTPPAPGVKRASLPPPQAPAPRVSLPTPQALVAREVPVSRARVRGMPPRVAPRWDDERPAVQWLDATARTAMLERSRWLEEEARALTDPEAQARALLSVSELRALAGDRTTAFVLATEARELGPHMPLTWYQARQLMDSEPTELVEALDAEASHALTPASRAHATLLAAEYARIEGDVEAALARWEEAIQLDVTDVRAVVARAAIALGRREHTSAALDLSTVIGLEELDRAVGAILGLRGAGRTPGVEHAFMANDALRRVRAALESRDLPGAQAAVAEVGRVAGLVKAAGWLSSTFGAVEATTRRSSQKTLRALSEGGDLRARRALAARSLELADAEGVHAALSRPEAFTPEERAVLMGLCPGQRDGVEAAARVAAVAEQPELAPLAAALCATIFDGKARARHVAGEASSRARGRLARLVAAGASHPEVREALEALETLVSLGPHEGALDLDLALAEGRSDEVVTALGKLADDDEGAARDWHLVAGLVAERAGDRVAARASYAAARAAAPANESALRLVLAVDPSSEPAAELLALADVVPEGPDAALFRLEALAREEELPDATRVAELARAHSAAPQLGIPAFLAERIARRSGDVDEVLQWTRERRQLSTDPLESALDAVREALLIADRDAESAGGRLAEAHQVRPDDFALRELYERLATEPPSDRGAWREAQARRAAGPLRAVLFTEAALEFERRGLGEEATAAARAARETSSEGISRILLDRVELESSAAPRLADELIAQARATGDPVLRREAFERLADLDAERDRASALLWHRSVLEESPNHLPSLRYIEHALITESRDDELEPIFSLLAQSLSAVSPSECVGHAFAAARLRAGTPGQAEQAWESTYELAWLAYETAPTLWSMRALDGHARARRDAALALEARNALIERSTRMPETAALLVRASESAAKLGDAAAARGYLESAAAADPGDVVTWGYLAEACAHAGDLPACAEAFESLARTSVIPQHQLVAWYDAARTWLEGARDEERGALALEQAAAIDASYRDVFAQLFALYSAQKRDADLVSLLESRHEKLVDVDEKVALEVQLALALSSMGDLEKAREYLTRALAARPDNKEALTALASLSVTMRDFEGAEKAYVTLSRGILSPEEARDVFSSLADLYTGPLGNLTRAEAALKEVLKRFPDHVLTLEKLVSVHRRQNDAERAVEVHQELITLATDPRERLARLVELAQIHETTGRELRRAEQTLEAARKEFPLSVVALRALAEFFERHNQKPAMHVLLDRAAGDARRAFAGGRFVTSLFETLAAAYELRGKTSAANVVSATLAALEGRPAEIRGAEARAADPELDDLLAPEVLSPALRGLLASAGNTLDRASPADLAGLGATPLPPSSPLAPLLGAVANAMGLGRLEVLASAKLGSGCLPVGSSPPTLVIGEKLFETSHERARAFQIVRALKLVQCRASALVRGKSDEVNALVSAWLALFNPGWKPTNVAANTLQEMQRRLEPAMPEMEPNLGVTALEAAGLLGTSGPQLRAATLAWSNRAALLAVGDPNAALDAIAWSLGDAGAPSAPDARAAWVARNAEARDLMTFSVSDAYAEARSRLGL